MRTCVSKHCDNLQFCLISTISKGLRHNVKLYITVFLCLLFKCMCTYADFTAWAGIWISHDLSVFRGTGRKIQGVQWAHQSLSRVERLQRITPTFSNHWSHEYRLPLHLPLDLLFHILWCQFFNNNLFYTQLIHQSLPFTCLHTYVAALTRKTGKKNKNKTEPLLSTSLLKPFLHSWLKCPEVFHGQVWSKRPEAFHQA